MCFGPMGYLWWWWLLILFFKRNISMNINSMKTIGFSPPNPSYRTDECIKFSHKPIQYTYLVGVSQGMWSLSWFQIKQSLYFLPIEWCEDDQVISIFYFFALSNCATTRRKGISSLCNNLSWISFLKNNIFLIDYNNLFSNFAYFCRLISLNNVVG